MKDLKLWWFIGLMMLGLGIWLRILIARVIPTHLTPDSQYYHQLAINLIEGKGFSLVENGVSRPVHEHTPGYSLFLAGLYSLIPGDGSLSDQSLRVTRVIHIQQLLSFISPIIFGWGLYPLFKRKELVYGYIVLSWVFFPYIVSANYLLSETWGLFLFSILFSGFTYGFKGEKRWIFPILGIVFGSLIMVRPAMIVIWPIYGLWLMIYGKKYQPRRFLVWGLFTLGLLLPVFVWILRTGLLTQHWVPVQVGVPRVLVDGGCPNALCGMDYRKLARWVEPIYMPKAENTQLNWGMIWWWYGVKKVRDYLGFPMGYLDFRHFGTSPLLWQMNFWSYIVIIGLFIAAGILALRRKNAWTLPLVIIMGGMIAHSLFWAEPRHALMYLPLFVGLAIFGGQEIIRNERLKAYLFRRRGWLIILGWLLVLWLGLVMGPSRPGDNVIRFWVNRLGWIGVLVGLWRVVFWRVKYSKPQTLMALIFVWMMWGLLIALWYPVRINLWSEAPKDDYLFPVGVTLNNRLRL